MSAPLRSPRIPHAEGLGEAGDAVAQGAAAENAQGLAGQVADGVIEIAELLASLPASGRHRAVEGADLPGQGQQQGKDVLRHGFAGVAAHVGDNDAAGPASLQIDVVVASGGDGDHLQLRQAGDDPGCQQALVDDRDGGAGQALGDLILAGSVEFHPIVGKGRAADVGDQGAGFEGDDAVHGRRLIFRGPKCRVGQLNNFPLSVADLCYR